MSNCFNLNYFKDKFSYFYNLYNSYILKLEIKNIQKEIIAIQIYEANRLLIDLILEKYYFYCFNNQLSNDTNINNLRHIIFIIMFNDDIEYINKISNEIINLDNNRYETYKNNQFRKIIDSILEGYPTYL